jgi:hypothetical protein
MIHGVRSICSHQDICFPSQKLSRTFLASPASFWYAPVVGERTDKQIKDIKIKQTISALTKHLSHPCFETMNTRCNTLWMMVMRQVYRSSGSKKSYASLAVMTASYVGNGFVHGYETVVHRFAILWFWREHKLLFFFLLRGDCWNWSIM